jgi:hypothetical protein
MAPGTWAELATIGAEAAWTSTGISRVTLGYSEDLLWDPLTKTATFLGSDHGACVKVPRYHEATNTWSLLPQPAWTPQSPCIQTMHGYDESALNPATGHFYHRRGGSSQVWRRDPATGTWTALPPLTLLQYVSCCGALEWVPPLGLIFVQGGETTCSSVPGGQCGGVFRFNEATQQWTRLGKPATYGMKYQNFLEYSPVHRVAIFGEGTSVHRLNADGTITTMGPAPIAMNTYWSLVTTDPVSGDFLFFSSTEGAKVAYRYHPITGVYTRLTGIDVAPIWNASQSYETAYLFNVLAMPLPQYQVVMFVKAHYDAGKRVYLYKPPQAIAGPVPVPPDPEPVPVPPVPEPEPVPVPPDSDFATRCAASGVIRCEGFDTAQPPNAIQPGYTTPVLDRVVRASGASALKFTIPTNSPENMAGSFNLNFTPGSTPFGPGPYPAQFGQGEQFFIQWRMRFSPEFLTTNYRATDGRGTGPKLMIVGTGDQPGIPAYSCTGIDLVVMSPSARPGVPMVPQMYHSCGAKDSQYEGLTEGVIRPGQTTGDFRLQNAIRNPAAPTDVTTNCLWTQPGVPPCAGLKPDQWMTFQLRVKVGTWYRNTRQYRHDSEVQLWLAEAGKPSRLILDYRPAADPACHAAYPTRSVPPCQTGYDLWGDGIQKFGKLWFTPYMTGKDPTQVHPTAYVWVDDVIISRNRIPDPGAP